MKLHQHALRPAELIQPITGDSDFHTTPVYAKQSPRNRVASPCHPPAVDADAREHRPAAPPFLNRRDNDRAIQLYI